MAGIPGAVVALLCYVVALNVIAAAAHVHPWLAGAVLTALAVSATALAGPDESRGSDGGRRDPM